MIKKLLITTGVIAVIGLFVLGIPCLFGILLSYTFLGRDVCVWLWVLCLVILVTFIFCFDIKRALVYMTFVLVGGTVIAYLLPSYSIVGTDGNQRLVANIMCFPEVIIAEGKNIEEHRIRAQLTNKMDCIHSTIYIVKEKNGLISLCTSKEKIITDAASIEIYEHKYEGRAYDVFKVTDKEGRIHLIDYRGRDVYGESYDPVFVILDTDDYGW